LTADADQVHIWFSDDMEAVSYAERLNAAVRGMPGVDSPVFQAERIEGAR
jgi:hypothetical protein